MVLITGILGTFLNRPKAETMNSEKPWINAPLSLAVLNWNLAEKNSSADNVQTKKSPLRSGRG